MKSLLFILLISFINVRALEIQCQVEHRDEDFVLKRSPQTERTYALLMTKEELKEYVTLDPEFILTENQQGFHYQEPQYFIEVDLSTGQGKFQLPLQEGLVTQNLSHCLDTD